jgi:hypothetical protein
MAEMKEIKIAARKRRAKLLDELNRKQWTVTKLALHHGVTPARMGQLIKKAKDEIHD